MGLFSKKKSAQSTSCLKVEVAKNGEQANKFFKEAFNDFKGELSDGITGQFPAIDNGEGPKRTIHKDINLRYGREKLCQTYGRPADRFQNYSVQANRNADDGYLRGLAANNNGVRLRGEDAQWEKILGRCIARGAVRSLYT